ncbi:OpgC domain-containing protein [uncultured Cohaesibacter sp.]|uniref:OpgC family protein n=1 Tax=uncultured Cohaesibacter sp. TaxID=1002546 RepID=UPI0029C65762|nr:OpgC domain-containing protein [uncultured Cohaesibacter sp.]
MKTHSSYLNSQPSKRDIRIDVLRGLALITIFIDHAPMNIWASYTIRNFGFSDAAEAFILMSGIAAGLAYSSAFWDGKIKQTSLKIWKRAAVIYGSHVLSIITVIAFMIALAQALPVYPLIKELHILPFLEHPVEATIGLFLLTYQLGYFNILPIYVLLLLMLPALLLIGRRRLSALFWLSALLWLATHIFTLYMPGWPTGARWFINPFGWQLLFVIGLMVGIRKKQGLKLVPFIPSLYFGCIAFLGASLWWQVTGRVELPRYDFVPNFVYDMTKDNLAFLRLLHILALGYFIANTRWIGKLLCSGGFRHFAILGQASLTSFVTGSLLVVCLAALHATLSIDEVESTTLLLLGIAIQYSLAWWMISAKKRKRASAPSVVGTAGRENASAMT